MIKRCFLFTILISSSLLFSNSHAPTIIDLKNEPPAPHSSKRMKKPKRDHSGFNGAPEIGHYLVTLAEKNGITTAFETGTYRGETTRFLSKYFSKVFTAEISDDYFFSAQEALRPYFNIECHHGSSNQVLQRMLPSLVGKPILFYLDAHWYDQWPLLDELEMIGLTHKDNCIVVIDDFKVPSRPEIIYDKYEPHECSFDYINEQLDKIFTDYTCFYLIPKNIDARAKFVAYPKSWD